MGLRREVLEEMEERESQTCSESFDRRVGKDSDADFHGIGWNILHKKFVDDDEPTASEREIMRVKLENNRLKRGL